MGFEYEPKTYVLVFTGDLEGLEVRMSQASLSTLFNVSEVIDELEDITSTKEALAFTRDRAVPMIVENGIGWNMERKGVPVPWTAEGVTSYPEEIAAAILKSWFAALLGHATNTESSDGEPEGEAPDFMNDGTDEPLDESNETG